MRKFLLAVALTFAIPARATVTGSYAPVSAVADGVVTTYYFAFQCANATYLHVTVGGSVASNFTTTLSSNQTTSPGGAITFLAPPANGLTVAISRVTPITQLKHWAPGSAFPATALEGAVDQLTMALQEVQPVTLTQAQLGTPANGVFLYCSDCTVSNPCAGGGTGALAKRLNGAWVCN